jgi:hypothetical protein
MPNGEFRFSRNAVRTSATPSPIGVAQERDAIGALPAAARLLLEQLHEVGLHALLSSGRSGALLSAHQHVAIGQHVDPARMHEVRDQRVDLESLRP